MINKRLFLAGLTTGLLSLSVAFPAMAGSWKNGAGDNAARWWYDNGDNTWAANGWRWIDGNQDGVSECYYFDAEGWLLTSTTTPDGYTVNADGAWTVNGIAQSRQTAASNEFDNESWDDFQNSSSKKTKKTATSSSRTPDSGSSDSSTGSSEAMIAAIPTEAPAATAIPEAPVRPKKPLLLPETKSRMLQRRTPNRNQAAATAKGL